MPPPGIVQFNLPLASLAPDKYTYELAAANPTGTGTKPRNYFRSA